MSVVSAARGPGAVRSEASRLAILNAAAELIARDGYERLTIEGIAARARVGKPTIYRWWNSKSALIAECLVAQALLPDAFVPPNSGRVVADIAEWLGRVMRFLSEANNMSLIRSLIAASVDNQDVAVQLAAHLGATPDSLEGRLRDALDAGELKPGTPVRRLTESLLGVIIFRVLSNEPFEPDEAEVLAPLLLSGSLANPLTAGERSS